MMQVIHEKNHLKEMNALGQLTLSYTGNGYTTLILNWCRKCMTVCRPRTATQASGLKTTLSAP